MLSIQRITQPNAQTSLASILSGVVLTVCAVIPVSAYHYPWDQGHDTATTNQPSANDTSGSCEGG